VGAALRIRSDLIRCDSHRIVQVHHIPQQLPLQLVPRHQQLLLYERLPSGRLSRLGDYGTTLTGTYPACESGEWTMTVASTSFSLVQCYSQLVFQAGDTQTYVHPSDPISCFSQCKSFNEAILSTTIAVSRRASFLLGQSQSS
jgi:hypothetical protein